MVETTKERSRSETRRRHGMVINCIGDRNNSYVLTFILLQKAVDKTPLNR